MKSILPQSNVQTAVVEAEIAADDGLECVEVVAAGVAWDVIESENGPALWEAQQRHSQKFEAW